MTSELQNLQHYKGWLREIKERIQRARLAYLFEQYEKRLKNKMPEASHVYRINIPYSTYDHRGCIFK